MSVYENKKVLDLRTIARSRKLKGWSRLRKDDLIYFIIGDEDFTLDRATEVAMRVGRKTAKELKDLAGTHNVKIPLKANKNEIIYLLGEDYGRRRRVRFERKYGLWDTDIKANEETDRWTREIEEEERARKTSEPPKQNLRKKL